MKKILSKILIIVLTLCVFSSCGKKTSTTTIGNKTFDTTKIYNICIAQSSESKYLDDMRKGLIVGLKNQGLVEDINVKFHFENAKGETSYATQIAEAFIGMKPDLVIGIGEKCSIALNDTFKDTKVPVVSVGVSNAESLGFCKSDKMPLSNITGVIDSLSIDTVLERINIKYPKIKKLGIIYDANGTLAAHQVNFYKFYGTAFNIDIFTVKINTLDGIDKAIENIVPKVDGVMLIIDEKLRSSNSKIVSAFKNANKPIIGYELETEDLGADVVAKFSKNDIGGLSAVMVKNILFEGAKAKDIKFIEVDPKPIDELEETETKEGE